MVWLLTGVSFRFENPGIFACLVKLLMPIALDLRLSRREERKPI